MKIVVIDTDETFRLSLVKYIKDNLNHVVVDELSSCVSLLKLDLENIDIVIIDISKNRSSIYEISKELFWSQFHISLLAIAEKKPTKETLIKLVEIGIKGFILKDNLFKELNEAFNHITTDRYYYPSKTLLLP